MEKKNTLVLTIISIATLFVAVVSATFAYFASGASGSQTIVNVTTASAAAFSSNITGSLEVYADATNMADDSHKGNWVGSNTANIEVKLSADAGTYCTYDINVVRSSDSDNYTRLTTAGSVTSGGGLFLKALWGGSSTSLPAAASGTTFYGNNTYLSATEAEFIDYPSSASGTFKLASGKITVPSNSTSATTNLAITIYFKNLTNDQLANAGKKFKGEVKVTNIVCKNSAGTTIASGS